MKITQYPTQELFSPLYILLVPKVEIKLGTHNNICTATEMVEHVLHCAYAVCGRWLLLVATDAQGEYVQHARWMLSWSEEAETFLFRGRLMEMQTVFFGMDLPVGEGGFARRAVGLLWQWICAFVSRTTLGWRVVVGKVRVFGVCRSMGYEFILFCL